MEPIYRFRIADKMYAVDVENCFVLELDALSWEVFEYYGKSDSREIVGRLSDRFDPQEIEKIIRQLDSLRSQGYIFKEGQKDKEAAEEPIQYAVALLLKDSTGNVMSKAVAENAVDFLTMKSGGCKKLKIEFIVPTSGVQPGIIEEIYTVARIKGNIFKKDIQFCLTVTGISFDSGSKWGEVDVTMNFADLKEIKGLLKYLSSAKKEAKGRLAKIGKFLSAVEKSNARGTVTFTPAVADFMEPVAMLFDMGFTSVSLGCAQALSTLPPILREPEDSLKKAYETCADYYISRLERDSHFVFHPFKPVFNLVYGGKKCARRCEGGRRSLTVSPAGDIYPCPQFAVMGKCRMGNVVDHTDYDPALDAQFNALSVNDKEDCAHCWARYLCGGGCPYAAYLYNETVAEPYRQECDLVRHIIQYGVMAYSGLEEKQELYSQVGKQEGQNPPGFSFDDGQVSIRRIEKSDLETIDLWNETFSAGYFLTEGIAAGLLPQQKSENLPGTDAKVELIMMNNRDKTPLGLFRGYFFPPFRRGEFSLFAPDREKLKEKEFYRMGRLLLQTLFRRWGLHRTFTILLETEAEYVEYLKQFGFKMEGLMREQIFHQGKYLNLLVMGLSKEEFKSKWWK
jgi:uncharacterized protein